MKRLITLIALLGLAVGMLAGCNQSGSENTNANTNNAAPPASTNK